VQSLRTGILHGAHAQYTRGHAQGATIRGGYIHTIEFAPSNEASDVITYQQE